MSEGETIGHRSVVAAWANRLEASIAARRQMSLRIGRSLSIARRVGNGMEAMNAAGVGVAEEEPPDLAKLQVDGLNARQSPARKNG